MQVYCVPASPCFSNVLLSRASAIGSASCSSEQPRISARRSFTVASRTPRRCWPSTHFGPDGPATLTLDNVDPVIKEVLRIFGTERNQRIRRDGELEAGEGPQREKHVSAGRSTDVLAGVDEAERR